MFNHKVLLFVGAMAASAAVTISAYGQTTVSPKELGQIVDEAMRNVLPPTQMASRVPVSSRKVRFDKVRTAADNGTSTKDGESTFRWQ